MLLPWRFPSFWEPSFLWLSSSWARTSSEDALACLSPGLCAYSAQVRPYSLLPLLCLLSVYFLWQGLTTSGKGAWTGYTLATLALVYTHNFSWLVVLGEWVAVGLCFGLPALRAQGQAGRRGFLLSQALIVAGFAPWMPVLLYQARHAGYGPVPLRALPAHLRYSLGLAFGVPARMALPCLATLLVATVWLFLRLRAKEREDRRGRQLAVWLCLCVP